MPTVLASGFAPFLPYGGNPSWDALALAQPALPRGWRLERLRLDVAWSRAAPALLDALTDDVRVVIAFGQADDSSVRIERFAHNTCDPARVDVDGERFDAEAIVPGGPAICETGLPCTQLLAALHERGIAAAESHCAGGYLCNHVFYRLLYEGTRDDRIAGFVHVPPARRLALAHTRAAIECVIEACVGYCESSSCR